MTKLSETQSLILSAASQRPELIALPLPASLRGGAAAKVVGAMIAKGFLQEAEADPRKGELMWRETGDGHGTTLIATGAGLAAIGIETSPAEVEVLSVSNASNKRRAALHLIEAEAPAIAKAKKPRAPKPAVDLERKKRDGTKQAAMISMLRAPDGTTIHAIMEATGWQAHTVRGAFAGALKKAGLTVSSEKVEGRGRVYRIA